MTQLCTSFEEMKFYACKSIETEATNSTYLSELSCIIMHIIEVAINIPRYSFAIIITAKRAKFHAPQE